MKCRFHLTALGLAWLVLFAAGCGDDNSSAAVPTSTATSTRTSTATPPTPVTSTPTGTSTPTPIPTATLTPVPTATAIPSATPSVTPTPTPVPTNTVTFTSTPTPTPTLPGVALTGQLDLDIRWTAAVVLRVVGKDIIAQFTPNDAREFFVAGVPLDGTGEVHDFPEADAVLYAAKFASPAVTGGRCGSAPTSVSLTLLRRGTNDRVAGGLAVYCGADTYSGTAARVLHLAGTLTTQ